jgi:hypothetical protein
MIQLINDHWGFTIHNLETGETLPILTDWDYPSVASTFGWNIATAHRKPTCPGIHDTDGTVTCPVCHATPSDFIQAASTWMIQHSGTTAEDPGYFPGYAENGLWAPDSPTSQPR